MSPARRRRRRRVAMRRVLAAGDKDDIDAACDTLDLETGCSAG